VPLRRIACRLAFGGLLALGGPVGAEVCDDAIGGCDVIEDDTEVWVPAAPVEVEETAVVECPECQRGAWTFEVGLDVATQYFFRGILQEDAGFIAQPYGNVGVSLYESDGWLTNIGLNGGLWNSVHSRKTGASGPGGPSAWYEADAYGGLSLTMWEDLELNTLYTAYMSPNGAFNTVQEIAFGVGWDDSDLLGVLALHPGALVAVETDGTAFGGKKGQYVEVFGGPEFPITEGDWAFTVSVPMRLGLSLSDYYECDGVSCPTTATSGVNQNTFGFFDVGIKGDLALPFFHCDYGDWNLSSAVHFTSLGDSLTTVNNGDDWNFYGIFGLSMTY
jgi:hypothetical protein